MTAGSTVDTLVSTVERLWPDSDETKLVTGGRLHHRGGNGFLVVPDSRRPRLLVPAGNRRAAAAAMRRFSAGLSLRDIGQRLGAAAALRTAGSTLFRDRIIVSSSGDSLRGYLSDVLDQDVDVSIGIGPARANRKPVLEVFDSSGNSLAYVKVGDSPVAELNVRGEAAALATISDRFDVRLETPRVLHTGSWRGSFVLVMTSLTTSMRQPARRRWRVPFEEMNLLVEAFRESPAPLAMMPLWHRMTRTIRELTDEETRHRLEDALARLAMQIDGPLPVGAWHGDWTPWNMARRRDRVQLWDWERFETGVPAGLDAMHYGVNAMTKKLGNTIEAVSAGLRLAGADQRSPLGGIYLAAIACRYAASAEDELGHLVSARGRLMLCSLEKWLTDRLVGR